MMRVQDFSEGVAKLGKHGQAMTNTAPRTVMSNICQVERLIAYKLSLKESIFIVEYC